MLTSFFARLASGLAALLPPHGHDHRHRHRHRLAALAITAGLAAYLGCGASSPPALDCDTKAESRSYFLTSECGTGGFITVSTTPGSCAITVDGGYLAQVPSAGQFIAPGADGEFTLEEGNWQLAGSVRFAFHPPVDETVDCTAKALAADGTQALDCATTVCSDVGDEGSSCEEQLCTAGLYPPDMVPVVVDNPDAGALGLGGGGGGSGSGGDD